MRLKSTSMQVTMAHHRKKKLSSMVSQWIHQRNCPEKFSYRITQWALHDDVIFTNEGQPLGLETEFENQFLALLWSKPPFYPEMSRPKKVITANHFWSPVLLFERITMKKEALKKKCLSFRNRIAKFDNAMDEGLEWLKPVFGLSHIDLKPSCINLNQVTLA